MRRNIFFFFSFILLQSCVTDKFDFGKEVELSVHFSDDGLSLGGKNNADIPLSQIIELNDSGQLTTDPEGNYLFYKSGKDLEPVEVSIGQGNLGNAVDAIITDHIKSDENTVITKGRFMDNLSFSQSWDIKYQNDHQEGAVRDFIYISTPMTIDVYSDFTGFTDFTDNVKLTYEVPSYYDLADKSQLTETLTADQLREEHHHVINIIGVDFKRTELREGEKIGFNNYTGEMIMKGCVTVKGESVISSADYQKTNDPIMKSHIYVGSLGTKLVTGRFDKNEKVDLDPVLFDNLPDIVEDDEVVVDVENPIVRMSLDNELPANVFMDASLRSFKNDKCITQLNIGKKYGTDPIVFAGADETNCPKRTNIWISRIPTAIPDSVSSNVVVSNMMDIIKTIPEKVEILATANTDSTQILTLDLVYKYKATPRYELVAPLKMGPNMKIVYNTDIDDLHEDLKDTNIGELYFNADATNNIPLDLTVEVHPLNAKGEELSSIQIVKPEAIPGMSTKNITFRLINSSDNQMKSLDRISIKAYATSNETMAGKYLNKSQNIRLDNVKLQIKDTSINF